ncbi:SLBB domain-containing protein [Desulfobulbus sp. TB]|nr:SLBB domain-containing protein [Desulfobulbus sp. TB]
MMTTGSDSLSPCHSKSVICWILLILALCLPVCGQAVEGRKVISSRTENSSATLPTAQAIYNDKITHIYAAASATRVYKNKRGKTQHTSPAASSSTRAYRSSKRDKRDKRGKTQHTPPTASSSRQKSSLPPPVVGAGLAKGSAYAVGSEDVLAIEVFDNPELKGEYIVSTGGDIVFPLIGQVKVVGKTLAAIKKKLTHLLEKDYLYNPIVRVDVSKYLSKKVKIMGKVRKPGVYYLEGPTRLFDLLTRAGGIVKQPGESVMSGQKTHITRVLSNRGRLTTSSNNTKTYYVDLHQLLVEGKDETNVYLQSGDVIFIPNTSSFHVIGEVKKAGSFPFEEGMTLLKAIALASGLTEKADADAIVIKRIQNGKVKELTANKDADTVLQPSDTIIISQARSIEIVGEVKKPGSIPYEPGMTLLKAIDLAGGATLKGSSDNAIIKRLSNGQVLEMKANKFTSVRPNDTIFVPEVRSFHVTGEVVKPGSFLHEPRLTLLKAIAMAGGATKKGDPEDSIIKRLVNGEIKEIEATPSTLVQPDDVIEVPLSFW